MVLKSIIRKPYIWVASLLCLVIGSCKDFEDCRSLYTSQISLVFIPQDKNNASIFAYDYMGGLPNNPPYKAPKPNHGFYLPLNPAADSTTFYLYKSRPTASVDTITIYYQRYPSLISPQCGAQQEYVLDSLYTTFAGDSIINRALRRELDKKITADVQIFY